ncbi:MAG TPA: ECF transporter S component [Nocardioidaceae bacterium]|nr:ECF transporter S component [Nocardioidaceae bacterium]
MSSSVGTPAAGSAHGRKGTVLATRPLLRYRTIDLVSAAMLGVAFGVVFWAWGLVYNGPSEAMGAIFAPMAGLWYSPWLIAGVVGGVLIRRPGAALITEVVAATVSALIGTQWGWLVLASGVLQGLGVELALALFAWKRFGPGVVMLAGFLSATFEVFLEWNLYYADWSWTYKLAYLGFFGVSGAVVAGLGGLALVRALARAGAVNAMPPGQEELERTAV